MGSIKKIKVGRGTYEVGKKYDEGRKDGRR